MRKKAVFLVVAAVMALFLCSVFAGAAGAFYVNGGSTQLSGLLSGYYAIGSGGTTLLGTDNVCVLTAAGTQTVGSDNSSGGGGLVSVGGSVHIQTETVKVGLRYYYSENRDSSMEAAHLENAVGSGYAFGYLDANRRFVQFDETAVTDVRTLTMRPDGAGGVGVYHTETDELLYSKDWTDRTDYLVIHPLSADGDSVTWFAQRRYYGDFAYADLGNGKLTVVNILPLEQYLRGVCAAEMSSGFPLEALKAQAVAARTYAAFNFGGVYSTLCGFDLTNDTYSQAYTGYTDSQRIAEAVSATANEYLTYRGKLANALYFAADGGATLDSELVFPNALPYLRGYADPYEESVWTNGPSGHCVGMSQWGAYAMAKNFNKTYQDILGFYYTGVGISYGAQ